MIQKLAQLLRGLLGNSRIHCQPRTLCAAPRVVAMAACAVGAKQLLARRLLGSRLLRSGLLRETREGMKKRNQSRSAHDQPAKEYHARALPKRRRAFLFQAMMEGRCCSSSLCRFGA